MCPAKHIFEVSFICATETQRVLPHSWGKFGFRMALVPNWDIFWYENSGKISPHRRAG